MARQYQAADVAACIIVTTNSLGSKISNLRLQKTLFFCQSEYLREFGQPLFSDKIAAWQYGPVVESVYYTYSHRGASNILKPSALVTDSETRERRPPRELSGKELSIVRRMVDTWKDKSVWDLVNETHKKGGAWDRTYNRDGDGSGYGKEITIDMIVECSA